MQDHENDPLTPDESDFSLSDSEPIEETSPSKTEVGSVANVSEPVIAVNDEENLPKEESRSRKAFRKFIRWTVGLLVVFGVGFLTAVFVIYNPKVDELDQSKNNLDSAGTTISELEAQISDQQDEIDRLNSQVDTLNLQIDGLEKELQVLSETQSKTQDDFNLHLALLKTRTDIANAHIEIYEGNIAQARLLLTKAHQGLTIIESLLSEEWKEVIPRLKSRLDLAIDGINDDPESTMDDLIIISSDLLQIKNDHFNE